MGRGSILVLAVSGVAACGALAAGPELAFAAASAAARPAAPAVGPGWGTARDLPGAAVALSCSSPGNCVVGGDYPVQAVNSAAFVAEQRNGTWGKAMAVPGLASLDVGEGAGVYALSCTAPGDCTAGGKYSPGGAFKSDAFVVTEKGGTWGKAIEVPGTAALNAGEFGWVDSVSCWSPGDCTADGQYTPGGANPERVDSQVFVVTEKDGIWGRATGLPGLAALNTGDSSWANSLSCTAGGNCALGGFYTTASDQQQAFVADESAGAWQPAEEFPGTGVLNVTGDAAVGEVSCTSPGNCGAVGYYSGKSFAASETNGTWHTPDTLPDAVGANSISCTSAGNCVAGGGLSSTGGESPQQSQAIVVTERNGTWGKPQSIPGLASLNVGQSAAIVSLSCSAPGDCGAGGYYANRDTYRGGDQAFVVTETDGTWDQAEAVPGVSSPTATNGVAVYAASCVSPRACTVSGSGFVVSTKTATVTTESLSTAKVTYGREQAERVSVAVAAKIGGPPAGNVTVRAGPATLCVITLRSGQGSCTLTARRLSPGTYHLTAAYPGSPDFDGYVSCAKTLTVVK